MAPVMTYDIEESTGDPWFRDLTALLLPAVTPLDVLELVVNLALEALDGVDGASVSLVHHDGQHFDTSNATSPDVRAIDEAQYDRAEGPCVHAIRSAHEVVVDLPTGRWPEFSEKAVQNQVRSVSSLPLLAGERPMGALNLYSRLRPSLGSETLRLARGLAAQAAVVLANSTALTVARMTNLQLQEALQTRDVIGQAKGMIMARERVDAEEAFDILRRASQRTNRKLREIAAGVVKTSGDPGAPG